MKAQKTFRTLAPLGSCACGFEESLAHALDRPKSHALAICDNMQGDVGFLCICLNIHFPTLGLHT